MRINLHNKLFFLILVIINFIALFEIGVIGAFLISIVVVFLKIFVTGYYLQKPMYKKMTLETFPQSHFVEKTRWIMDYLNIDYQEEVDVGVLGLFLQGRSLPCLHIPNRWASGKKGPTTYSKINDSFEMLRYFYGINYNNEKIEQFLRPTQERLDMEQQLFQLGNAIQFVGYHFILKDDENAIRFWGLYENQPPQWQKFLIKMMSPLLIGSMKKNFKSKSQSTYDRNIKLIQEQFDQIEQLLKKNNGESILSGGVSFVDFTFCSFAALIVFPGYKKQDQELIFDLYNKGNAKQSFYKVTQEIENEINTKLSSKYPLVFKFVIDTFQKFRNQKI